MSITSNSLIPGRTRPQFAALSHAGESAMAAGHPTGASGRVAAAAMAAIAYYVGRMLLSG